MPPRLPLRPIGGRNAFAKKPSVADGDPICLFCSLSYRKPVRRLRTKGKKAFDDRRLESTISSSTTTRTAVDPRKELEEALVDLQKRAPNYVNLSRVQLALNGLRQPRGNESIRIAILGVKDGPRTGHTAKEALRLLLADPLKPEEDWEKDIDSHDLSQPLIVRVGPEKPRETSFTRGNLLHEINVSSAVLNSHNIELLLMDTNPLLNQREGDTLESFEDSILVPAVDIPMSKTGRHTPITTPVHKALIVADGFKGAASMFSVPALGASTLVSAAVDLPSYRPEEAEASTFPFTPVDVGTARAGLGLVRRDLGAAIEFEHLWFRSNVPKLVKWLTSDTLATDGNTTKPPVKALVASLLVNTSIAMERELASKQRRATAPGTSSTSVRRLRANLETWAENAHGELQEQLNLAFASKRWRRLRWWKLFWRVDDVGMFTNDIISQRFLTAAEKNSIFLAGQMHEAGIPSGPAAASNSGEITPQNTSTSLWPANIAAARDYLQTDTIPALQALAQKLVMQTLTTTGLTSSLGALVYLGTLTTTVYEAGAVAALGVVWSMKRMQKQWEAARDFWEGEVREEGRKAVRDAEREFGKSLTDYEMRATGKGPQGAEKSRELDQAKELVQRAWRAYEKLD
ncbi:hypothetical protein DL764_003889 [Monosporascus ibericus]|uniref:Mmc1 C-terminal domain-containing protein n=1 Tax=Monosporascus ibericus TaxID=155417 RepID=A0A4Q4TES3_9PEZI|nr:hypothetical protein DL764_003889 [Monosporascus ibericus]